MGIGFEDDFDYLNETDSDANVGDFAPKIKGASKVSLVPEESEGSDEKKSEDEEKVEEEKVNVPEKKFESVIFAVKVTTNKEDKALEMIRY
jgi:hypothetical protein